MNGDKIILYIIAGANGSGKSTLAETFLKTKELPFLNADDIAKELCPHDIESVKIKAGKLYLEKFEEYIEKKVSFVAETTLSGKTLEKLVQKAKNNNYKITFIYSYLNDFIKCIKRVKTRVLNGGHNVKEEDITRRYYRSIINFWKYKDLADEWSLFYNGEEYFPILVAQKSQLYCDIIDKENYNTFLKITDLSKMLENAKEK